MAKKRGRHVKQGGRTTPRGTRPLQLVPTLPAHQPVPSSEPSVYDLVDLALEETDPLTLLGFASSLVWLASPDAPGRPGDLPTVAELVGRWGADDDPATTALLRAVAVLGDDEPTRRRAGVCAANRAHRLPGWVDGLARAEVSATTSVSHLLGDGEMLLLELRIPGSRRVTLCVFVDHNLGTIVKHAYIAPTSLSSAVQDLIANANPAETLVIDVSPADACARLVEALAHPLSLGLPSVVDDDSSSWPRTRPIVQWVVRMLPEGGRGYDRPVVTQDAVERLVTEFFASPWGRAIDDRPRRRLLDHLVELAAEDDDPMRWSPTRVDLLPTEELSPISATSSTNPRCSRPT